MTRNGRAKGETQFLLGLAAGWTVKKAAAEAGIGQRTAFRYLKVPAFRQKLRQLQCAATDQAVQRLASTATTAADTLGELLGSKDERVRLAAARYIAEFGRKVWESERQAMTDSAMKAETQAAMATLGEAVRKVIPEEEMRMRLVAELQKIMQLKEANLGALAFAVPKTEP
jgi:hypothetical protein